MIDNKFHRLAAWREYCANNESSPEKREKLYKQAELAKHIAKNLEELDGEERLRNVNIVDPADRFDTHLSCLTQYFENHFDVLSSVFKRHLNGKEKFADSYDLYVTFHQAFYRRNLNEAEYSFVEEGFQEIKKIEAKRIRKGSLVRINVHPSMIERGMVTCGLDTKLISAV